MQKAVAVLLLLFSTVASADSVLADLPICLSLDAKPRGSITIVIQGNPEDGKMPRLTVAIQEILGDSNVRVAIIDLDREVCIPVN
jgi:hypothetical protein